MLRNLIFVLMAISTLGLSLQAFGQNKVVVIPMPEGKSLNNKQIAIPASAFSATVPSLEVIKGTGTGGAYISGGGNIFESLVAPVVIPNGATVIQIQAYYRDNSFPQDLNFRFDCNTHVGAFQTRASASSTSFGTNVRSVLLSGVPFVIDTSVCAYLFTVQNDSWSSVDDVLRMHSVVIDYTITE